jgi:ferredoxin
MKVTVNEKICIGAGNCAQISPKIFAQRADDGTVILLVQDPEPELFASIQKAVKNCPSGAISISES